MTNWRGIAIAKIENLKLICTGRVFHGLESDIANIKFDSGETYLESQHPFLL